MLRHASIYRVARSCRINQRSSVCQQKATMKKNICLPSKEKSAFSQLQRIENKLYHQTWSRAKLQTARRKLWCEKSFGEFWVPGKLLRLGGCFSAWWDGKGTRDGGRLSLLKKKVCIFLSCLLLFPEFHTARGVLPCWRELRQKMQHQRPAAAAKEKLFVLYLGGFFFPINNWCDVNAASCLFFTMCLK